MLTIVCLVPILFWRENYGSGEGGSEIEVCSLDGTCTTVKSEAESGPQSMIASLKASLKLICDQPIVLFLGLSQACFEGAVYTFGAFSSLFYLFIFLFFSFDVKYPFFCGS